MSEKVKIYRSRTTRVSSKHQVTLPVAALREAGIAVADVLDVTVKRGRIVLTRAPDRLEQLFGSLEGVWVRQDIEDLRDEWEH